MPAQLRDLARQHQRLVGGAMMKAAAEALQTLAADRLDGQLGIMTVLHTWGRNLLWHPHVHGLIPGVVVHADRSFSRTGSNYLFPNYTVAKVYRAILMRLLREPEDAPAIAWVDFGKHWYVHCRVCHKGPQNVLLYLARYTRRAPLPDSAIIDVSDQAITFRYRSHQSKRVERCKLPPQEFLRRLLQHSPRKGFPRIRYYGLLAPGARRKLWALRLVMAAALIALVPILARCELRARKTLPRCRVCGSNRFTRQC